MIHPLSSQKFSSSIWIFTVLIILLISYGCRSSEPVVEPEKAQHNVPEIIATDSVKTVPEIDYADSLQPNRELRAVWVATVANIDWPSRPGLPVDEQKKEMIDILNRAAALNFNAIIFQVRPAADALYDSPYEPWSYYLTGKMGQAPLPEYDPLEFAVAEAHKRGLELHAWFNPYRAGHPVDKSEISPNHVSKVHPDWVQTYGNYLWLDPGIPEVREYTIDLILDVVKRYDIDGVHFDDYFYPYPSYANGADFPDSESWEKAVTNGSTLSRNDWRRNNVNQLMKQLSEKIKHVKPHVKFGISPFGTWQPGFPKQTTGFNAYNELYADARLWLKQGWVDYFTPQLYYRLNQVGQPFPIMLDWWVKQNDHNRHIWPGLYTSRILSTWPTNEITGQLYTSRAFPNVTGAVHFSMKPFMENPDHFNRIISAGPNAYPSLIPASPWLSSQKPDAPAVSFHDYNSYWSININPKDEQDIQWWVIRSKLNDQWEIEYFPAFHLELDFFGGKGMKRPSKIIVSGINRAGIEGDLSKPIETDVSDSEGKKAIDLPENVVHREDWAKHTPLGYDANAVRRNLLSGDTLKFRDVTLIYSSLIKSMNYPSHLLGFSSKDHVEKSAEERHQISIQLFKNGVSERFILKAGEAFNWYGYHIGLIAINSENDMAQFEISTVTSLEIDRASARSTGSAEYRPRVPHQINQITLHHSHNPDSLQAEDDTMALLNTLFEWGADNHNWWDLPDHYVIDLNGNIYEGRHPKYAGETNTTYDPRGHLLINILGNCRQQEPTEAQTNAIAQMAAYAIQTYDLSVDDIYAHDDWVDISCAGDDLQKYLEDGTIRKKVEALFNQKEEQQNR